MSQKWDHRFLGLAQHVASWSKDPSRGVGCIIVSPERQVCATGFNGLPSGVEDLPERLERPTKYDLICHAEMNAIIQCARHGLSPVGATIYTSFSPCINCALAIVQAGITEVVTCELTENDQQWVESIDKAVAVFHEAGLRYRRIDLAEATPVS